MNELIGNKKKSEILAEYISGLGYGAVLHHSDIENIIMERYGTSKYKSEISRAKKILLKEYNRQIDSIRGDGYRVIKPDDFVPQALGFYRRGFNEMQKGVDTLENAPIKDMTEEGRSIHTRVYDRSVILLASMKGASAELKALTRRNPIIEKMDESNKRAAVG